jgi:hypothetical protein
MTTHSDSFNNSFRNDVDNLLSLLDTAEEIAAASPTAFTPSLDYNSMLEPTPLRPKGCHSTRHDEYLMKQLLFQQQAQAVQMPLSQESRANTSFSDLFSDTDDTPLDLEEAIFAPVIAGNMARELATPYAMNKGFTSNNSANLNNLFLFAHSCTPSKPVFTHCDSGFGSFPTAESIFSSKTSFNTPRVPNTSNPKVTSNRSCLSAPASVSSEESSCSSESSPAPVRFRKYQTCQWEARFQELLLFRQAHGHLLVPHSFPPNQKLAQWVKRQRHQHKRKNLGHHSTLTDDREARLLDAGFIFDSHRAVWYTRYETLKAFRLANGHCSIPSKFDDGSLNVWIKHQRRQYLLFKKGEKSTMTEERIAALDSIGFDWNPRNLVRSSFKFTL